MVKSTNSKPDDHAKIRPSDGVLACELGGGAALLDTAAGAYFSLNGVGAALWNEIEATATIGSLLAFMTESFDVPVQTARRDLDALIAALAEHRLIRIEQP